TIPGSSDMSDTPERVRPPIPAHISEEAKRYLEMAASLPKCPVPSDLGDVDGWLRYVEANDAFIEDWFLRSLPAELPLARDELEIDGVRTYVLRPDHVAAGPQTPIYLEIHGGALIMGGGELCARMGSGFAITREMVTWAVDYRMPPRHPYPAALDDLVAVYRRALGEHSPEDVFVGGASAGGNLAAALLLRAKDEGLAMPAALVLLSPEVDLTESGDSFHTNLGIDAVLDPLEPVNVLYANGHDLSHPYLSPLFGDVSGFPPTFLQSGTRDLFLSNTVRMHRKLRAAGVDAELHVFEAMPHGGFGGAPEDVEIIVEMQRFLERHRRRR
ncbi:MAG: alpha/beta hydrolase, partial [Candidatus Binatia bacterium]